MTKSLPASVACTSRPTAGSSSTTSRRTSPALYMRPPSIGLRWPWLPRSLIGSAPTSVPFVAGIMHLLCKWLLVVERRVDRFHQSRRRDRPTQQDKSLQQLLLGRAVKGRAGVQKEEAGPGISVQDAPRQIEPRQLRQRRF